MSERDLNTPLCEDQNVHGTTTQSTKLLTDRGVLVASIAWDEAEQAVLYGYAAHLSSGLFRASPSFSGTVCTAIVDGYDPQFKFSQLSVAGFRSNPTDAWLISIQVREHLRLSSESSYIFCPAINTGIWRWRDVPFGFQSDSEVAITIVHR